MVNYCIYCGAALPPDAQLCPRCGRLIPEVETPEPPLAGSPAPAEGPDAPLEPPVVEPPAPAKAQGETAAPAEGPAMPPEPPAPAEAQREPAAPAEKPAPPERPAQEIPAPPAPASAPQAPRYAAPKYMPVGRPAPAAQPYGMPRADLLTTGGVLGMVLLGLLPLVGWIVLLVWAFDAASGPNHRALAKGLLLAKLILGVLSLLLLLLFFGILVPALMSSYYWY